MEIRVYDQKKATMTVPSVWVQVRSSDNEQSLLVACRERLRATKSADIKIVDSKEIPTVFIQDGWFVEDFWKFLKMPDYYRNIVRAYLDTVDEMVPIEDILDRYKGIFDSAEQFTENYIATKMPRLLEEISGTPLVINWARTRDNLFNDFEAKKCGDHVAVFRKEK